MNNFEMTIANMTEAEVRNFDSVLEEAIEVSRRFNSIVNEEFLAFNINFEENNMLSTFFITAFLKAVKKRSKTGMSCYFEKFDEELKNIDIICEAKPELLDNYRLRSSLMELYNIMVEFAKATGMKDF